MFTSEEIQQKIAEISNGLKTLIDQSSSTKHEIQSLEQSIQTMHDDLDKLYKEKENREKKLNDIKSDADKLQEKINAMMSSIGGGPVMMPTFVDTLSPIIGKIEHDIKSKQDSLNAQIQALGILRKKEQEYNDRLKETVEYLDHIISRLKPVPSPSLEFLSTLALSLPSSAEKNNDDFPAGDVGIGLSSSHDIDTISISSGSDAGGNFDSGADAHLVPGANHANSPEKGKSPKKTVHAKDSIREAKSDYLKGQAILEKSKDCKDQDKSTDYKLAFQHFDIAKQHLIEAMTQLAIQSASSVLPQRKSKSGSDREIGLLKQHIVALLGTKLSILLARDLVHECAPVLQELDEYYPDDKTEKMPLLVMPVSSKIQFGTKVTFKTVVMNIKFYRVQYLYHTIFSNLKELGIIGKDDFISNKKAAGTILKLYQNDLESTKTRMQFYMEGLKRAMMQFEQPIFQNVHHRNAATEYSRLCLQTFAYVCECMGDALFDMPIVTTDKEQMKTRNNSAIAAYKEVLEFKDRLLREKLYTQKGLEAIESSIKDCEDELVSFGEVVSSVVQSSVSSSQPASFVPGFNRKRKQTSASADGTTQTKRVSFNLQNNHVIQP